MNKLRIGIIGLGGMGQLHLLNSLFMKDVEIIGACDKSNRALNFAKSRGIKNLYNDYDAFLTEKQSELDAVVISLPNFLHYESMESSINKGINVFIEKPMARNVAEAQKIIKLVDANDAKLMPGHCMRFLDAVEIMEKKVNDGNVGKIELITTESIQNGPLSHGLLPKPISPWWFDKEQSGGGVLLDIGYHLIDLFRLFCGEAGVLSAYIDYKMNLDVEDGATVILQSKNGSTRGVINVGWFEKTIFPKFNFRLLIHGNADYLSTDMFVPKNMYMHAMKEGTKNFLKKITGREITPLSYTYYYRQHYKELRYFYDCIKNDVPPKINAHDGLNALKLIEEIYNKSVEVI